MQSASGPAWWVVAQSPCRQPAREREVGADRAIALRQRGEEAKARLAAIVEFSEDAIVSKDLTGVITSWNRSAERLFGYTAQEAIGQPITLIIPADRRWEEQRILDAIRQGQTVEHFETVRQRKDGTLLEISVTISPIRNERGTIIGASKIARDVTERRQLEAAQRALEQAREEFLAAAAHDLKTPLTTIKGLAQLQQRRAAALTTPAGERLVGALRQIDTLVNDAVAQIDALLDVARLQTGQPLSLERTEVDLVPLARAQMARHQVMSTQHTLRLRTQADTLVGRWDRQRLERVLGNLLSNAIKYSPQGGPVTVTLRQEAPSSGRWAVLAVRDRGIGIPPAEVDRVFEPHYRASNVQGRIDGTGIGLAGTKQIVEQHGGTLTAVSRQGRETIFTVRLPILGEEELRDARD